MKEKEYPVSERAKDHVNCIRAIVALRPNEDLKLAYIQSEYLRHCKIRGLEPFVSASYLLNVSIQDSVNGKKWNGILYKKSFGIYHYQVSKDAPAPPIRERLLIEDEPAQRRMDGFEEQTQRDMVESKISSCIAHFNRELDVLDGMFKNMSRTLEEMRKMKKILINYVPPRRY